MLTQKQIHKRELKCDKKGHHQWRRRGKSIEVCENCGKRRIQDMSSPDNPVKIEQLTVK